MITAFIVSIIVVFWILAAIWEPLAEAFMGLLFIGFACGLMYVVTEIGKFILN